MSQKVSVFAGLKDGSVVTEVAERPIPQINDDEILVKAVAYAANPTDWKHLTGPKEPGVYVGSDVSGIVEKVGSKVTNFKKGDIVSATLHGNQNKRTGCFAEYVPAKPLGTVKYDPSTFNKSALTPGDHKYGKLDTFEAAAATTLSLATIGLSLSHSLHVSDDKAKNADRFILIWGGATAAGIYAIQVAKLVYGLKVITTASSKHHSYLKGLGADYVFDYNHKGVVDEIKSTGNGKIVYALDTVSTEANFQQTYDATEGTEEVNLDNLLFLDETSIQTKSSRKVNFTQTLVYSVTEDTSAMFDFKTHTTKELLEDFGHFWNDLLPPYIKELYSPNLKVLKSGLESANEAIALLHQNKVSAQKVVFRK